MLAYIHPPAGDDAQSLIAWCVILSPILGTLAFCAILTGIYALKSLFLCFLAWTPGWFAFGATGALLIVRPFLGFVCLGVLLLRDLLALWKRHITERRVISAGL